MNSKHDIRRHGPRRAGAVWPRTLLAGSLAVAVGLLAAATLPQGEAGEEVDAVRETIHQLTRTRQLISQEERDWRFGKELMNDHVGIVRGEMESLQQLIRKAEGELSEADAKRDELSEKIAKLDEAAGGLQSVVGGLEARLKELLVQLPAPIRERVEVLSQSIPEDPEDTDLTLGPRFRNVVGVLTEINKFHNDIHVRPETHELSNGRSAEVTVMYLGISQGYFVDATGTMAAVGSGTPEGWTWTERDDAAPEIAKAIAVYENTERATFVGLPLEVE